MSLVKKIGFFSAFIIPSLVIAGYHIGGWGNFITLAFVFFIIPLLDYLIGKDPENIEDEMIPVISKRFYYKLVLYIWVYIQTGMLFWGFNVVVFGDINTFIEWVGFLLSFSFVTGGIGITVAHELGHKKSKLERFYCKVLLMTVTYMHFYIEHNKGHHVHVATPQDPATARKDESFYKFWFRSVFGSYFHAWKIEFNRLSKKGKKKISIHNNMIWYTLLPFLFCAIITFIFSTATGSFKWEIPVFFFSQSILAFSLLELVNYIEHYGILRKEVEPGRYERVSPAHSWNANHLVSNFFLFQLQRHSDHHINATRRYQALKHYDESPQLPASYPTMIVVSLIPPLWFKLINPRLDEYYLKSKPINSN